MKPRSQASARSPTVVPEQRQTTPSVGGDDGLDPALPLEPDEPARNRLAWDANGWRADRDRRPEIETGFVKPLCCSGREQPFEIVARADRMDVRGARRDHDLGCPDVAHSTVSADDDHRAGVDRDDLIAIGRIQDDDPLAPTLGSPGRRASAPAATDHRDVDVEPLDPDLGADRRHGQVGTDDVGQDRLTDPWMTPDDQARMGRNLAAAHIGDAVDLDETVAAVPGETEGAAPTRRLAGAQDRDGRRVARLVQDRPVVGDEPESVGHWRIRRPSGSKIGRGCNRAGRRRPMISISNAPSPVSPASVVGT